MKLKELFARLADGELANLAMCEGENGTVRVADRPKIIRLADDGLLQLHRKFILKENELILEYSPDTTKYRLIPEYAVNYTPKGVNDDRPRRYIMDSEDEPFTGDVIKVMRVVGDYSRELPLNDEDSCLSVFTPQPDVIQFPQEMCDTFYSVNYQARHPKLQDDLEGEIILPAVLEGALSAWIAYRVYSSMNTADSSKKAAEHLAMYDRECATVKETDTVNSSVSISTTRFQQRGFR